MNRRNAYFTDEAAIAELFGHRSSKAEKIMREYVRPRHKKNKQIGERDNPSHFATSHHSARANETGIAEAQRVKRNLSALAWLPGAYVGKALAAVYCGVSEHTFDQRRRAMTAEGTVMVPRTQRRRPKNTQGKPIPGTNARVSFRMDLVDDIKAFRVPSDPQKATTAPSPRNRSVSGTLSCDAEGKAVITLDDASHKKLLWMVKEEEGPVFAHMAFNAQSPDAIAHFLTNGGTVERMTIHEALTERTWINLDERRGWATGYTRLLAEERGAVALKNRESMEARLRATLPKRAPSKRRRPFAVDR